MEQNIKTRVYIDSSEASQDVFVKKISSAHYFNIIFLIFFCLFIFLFLCFTIKYPDVQNGVVQLVNGVTNYKVISTSSGKMKLLIDDTTKIVSENQTLAVIQNAAELEDILKLENILFSLSSTTKEAPVNFPSLKLGELSSRYYALIAVLEELKAFLLQKKHRYNEALLEKKIITNRKILDASMNSLLELEERKKYIKNINKRDSLLYTKEIISGLDYEKDKVTTITSSQDLYAIERLIHSSDMSLEESKLALSNLELVTSLKEREIRFKIIEQVSILQALVREWKNRYLIISPCNGKLEKGPNAKNESFVLQNETIFSIVPINYNWHANLYINEVDAGKVIKGQKVLIKLNMFPYTEYGYLTGIVEEISNTPIPFSNKDSERILLLVKVGLPNPLMTNMNKTLPLTNELSGVGEILINEKRLFERFFSSLK